MQIIHRPFALHAAIPCLRRCIAVAGFSLVFATGSAWAQQFSFSNIADENTTAPGQGENFSDVVNTSLSGHTVSFVGAYDAHRGTDEPVDYGIYTANTTGTPVVSRVADDMNINEGGSTSTVRLDNPVISGSTVTFNANEAANNYNGDTRVYTGTAGTFGVNLIASLNTAAPGQTGGQTFTNVSNSAASGSNVVFGGDFSGGAGLYLNTAGTTGISRIVDSSSQVSGQTIGFTTVTGVSVSGSTAAFGAIYNKTATSNYYNLDGIFTTGIDGTGLTLAAGTGTAVPGQTGKTFTGFGLAAMKGTTLLFAAGYGTGSGLYQETVGSTAISRVVDTSTAVPGKGALTFMNLSGYATNGTNVVFTGSYGGSGMATNSITISPNAVAPPATQGEGIFLESGGNLVKILSTGDTLFGSTVTDVATDDTSYDGNEIAFSYILGNGMAGVAVVDIAVPEPATWLGGMLLLGGAGLGLRRRLRTIWFRCGGD